MGMNSQPETPLNKFFVEVTNDTLQSSHYFPADYDHEWFPTGERHKVTMTVTQDSVLVEIFNLIPDGEAGWWRWVRAKDFHISLAMSLYAGFDAVSFKEYDVEGDMEEVQAHVPEE
jgi:hypothetical protein